jgi:hypothetical protein
MLEATNKTASVAGLLAAVCIVFFSSATANASVGAKVFGLLLLLSFIGYLWFNIIVGKAFISEASILIKALPTTGISALFRRQFWAEFGAAAVRILFFGVGAAVVIVPIVIFDYAN